jgi:polyhydroxyalkanoate synthesis repressor PhaR
MNQIEPADVAPESAEAIARQEPKVIKRYTNRKLYDTVESRYVTLDEIAQMIKGGAEVKIIDNRSKEDLTSVTLAQIIFEEEKKRSQMPLGVLREIIRHGGDAVAGFYNEKVGQRINDRLGEVKSRAEQLREEMELRVRGVTSILRRDGKLEGKSDGRPEVRSDGPSGDAVASDAADRDGGGEAPAERPVERAAGGTVKEILHAGERAVEELRGRVDASVKSALEAVNATGLLTEMEKLQKKLLELEKKIEQLTK